MELWCPYQLGKCNDNPNVAHEMELNIKKDDILIVGTDGMLDNMNESDIEEIVQRAIDHKLKADELARKIGNVALFNSLDRFADTPFARASKRKGGKFNMHHVVMDYGVFVAGYAEYLSEAMDVPLVGSEAEYHLMRYAALLRNYGLQKEKKGYVNDNDDPPRPRTENNVYR
ncbi:hypothetical protein CQW23_24463 [Capsicum baccatum]|uniref:Uncharacterized protein n=1 Tax=Capsicum baccatum TaxID=33114 RepID=A0A2G2VUZ3_CAPBA|nr:hypothetical protein CQW23_24463 [Capsicum baccatum]